MADGSEFQVRAAATENAGRASSLRVLGTVSSGASDDRRERTGTAVCIRSLKSNALPQVPLSHHATNLHIACIVTCVVCSVQFRRSQAMSRVRHISVSRSRQRPRLRRAPRSLYNYYN